MIKRCSSCTGLLSSTLSILCAPRTLSRIRYSPQSIPFCSGQGSSWLPSLKPLLPLILIVYVNIKFLTCVSQGNSLLVCCRTDSEITTAGRRVHWPVKLDHQEEAVLFSRYLTAPFTIIQADVIFLVISRYQDFTLLGKIYA